MVQHKTQTVAYVRVSSTDQNLDRQLEAIGDVDRVFEEKVSGAPALTEQRYSTAFGTSATVTPSGSLPWTGSLVL